MENKFSTQGMEPTHILVGKPLDDDQSPQLPSRIRGSGSQRGQVLNSARGLGGKKFDAFSPIPMGTSSKLARSYSPLMGLFF